MVFPRLHLNCPEILLTEKLRTLLTLTIGYPFASVPGKAVKREQLYKHNTPRLSLPERQNKRHQDNILEFAPSQYIGIRLLLILDEKN